MANRWDTESRAANETNLDSYLQNFAPSLIPHKDILLAQLEHGPVTIPIDPTSEQGITRIKTEGRPLDPNGNVGYVTITKHDVEAERKAYEAAGGTSQQEFIPDAGGEGVTSRNPNLVPPPAENPYDLTFRYYAHLDDPKKPGFFGGLLGGVGGGLLGAALAPFTAGTSLAISPALGAALGAAGGTLGGGAIESGITGSPLNLFPARGLGLVGQAALSGLGSGIGAELLSGTPTPSPPAGTLLSRVASDIPPVSSTLDSSLNVFDPALRGTGALATGPGTALTSSLPSVSSLPEGFTLADEGSSSLGASSFLKALKAAQVGKMLLGGTGTTGGMTQAMQRNGMTSSGMPGGMNIMFPPASIFFPQETPTPMMPMLPLKPFNPNAYLQALFAPQGGLNYA